MKPDQAQIPRSNGGNGNGHEQRGNQHSSKQSMLMPGGSHGIATAWLCAIAPSASGRETIPWLAVGGRGSSRTFLI